MIQLEGVSKSFGENRAVDNIHYRFAPGRLTGFLGPNGAGKSTTIRMVMNILIPDSGTISADGRPLDEEFRNRLGYLPEERGLYPDMKVLDHLVFFGNLKGLSRREARQRGLRWLERLDLGERAQSKVKELSKGMQQKIQFAGTLLHDPEIVLLDEPFSGLDPVNTDALKTIMLELRDEGRTVIFSTHMMDHAERLCEDIALIHDGKLKLSGTLAEIRDSYGKGNLRVRFRGDESVIQGDRRVKSFHAAGQGLAELQLRDEKDVPAVARDWSAALEVSHFEVVAPSLHNIFIQTVGAKVPAQEAGGAA